MFQRKPDQVTIDRLLAAAAGLAVGAVYLASMACSVSFWDSGEYIACSWITGIPHPPCVPLFVLLGRFFTIILSPIPSVAVRTNLMCVIAGAVSMGLLARLAQRWGARMRMEPSLYRPVSVGAATIAGFSFTVWQNNNAMETYAVSQLMAMLAIWLFDVWVERTEAGRQSDRFLHMVCYLLTTAIGVHLAALIAVPGIVVRFLISAVDRRTRIHLSPRFLLTAGGLMLIAFSVHLYMPLRAVQRPEINETDPSEWPSFRAALAREQYGSISPFDRKGPVDEQIAQYLRYLSWQSGRPWAWQSIAGGAGMPLFLGLRFVLTGAAVWGLAAIWSRDRRTFWMLAAIFLMASAFFVFYLNFKTGPVSTPTGEVRDRDYFYADSFALFGLFAAFGLGTMIRGLSRRPAAAWGMLVLPLAACVGNFHECDRSGDYVARDYGINLLESCSEGAVLITNGDNDTFPLWFAQSVLGVRRDVIVSNLSLMNTNWYVEQLLDRDPALMPFGELGLVDSLRPVFVWGPHYFHVGPDGMPVLSRVDGEIMRAVFDQAWPWSIRHGGFCVSIPYEGNGLQGSLAMQDLVLLSMVGRRPLHGRDVYLAGTVSTDSRYYLRNYLEMEGIAFRVTEEPVATAVDPVRGWELLDGYLYTGLADPSVFKEDQAVQIARNYVSAYHRLASHHVEVGEPEPALAAMRASRELFSAMPDAWMEVLPSQAMMEARIADGLHGPDSAAALMREAAGELASWAGARGDERAAALGGAMLQIASDYQREEQFLSFADSVTPPAAAAWMRIEVCMHFGNYLTARDVLEEYEASSPGDPFAALMHADMERFIAEAEYEERFGMTSSALSMLVQQAGSPDPAAACSSMISMVAAGRGASAAAGGLAMGSIIGGTGKDILDSFALEIALDPDGASYLCEWYVLESARVDPAFLAWECAVVGKPWLLLPALSGAGEEAAPLAAAVLERGAAPGGWVDRITPIL